MQGKKILIVDDEESIVYSLSLLLNKENYEIASASNGVEALSKYKSFLPDIILLDIMMPIMDGYKTAEAIRNLDHSSSCRIIFLTAKGTLPDKMNAYAIGGDDYLVKPFENEILLEKIRMIS